MTYFIDSHEDICVGQLRIYDDVTTGFQCLFQEHINMWPVGSFTPYLDDSAHTLWTKTEFLKCNVELKRGQSYCFARFIAHFPSETHAALLQWPTVP